MKSLIIINLITQIVLLNTCFSQTEQVDKTVDVVSDSNVTNQKIRSVPDSPKRITFEYNGEVKVANCIIGKCVNSNHQWILEGAKSNDDTVPDDSAYLVFDTIFRPVGPGLDEFQALMYTKSGKLISDIKIGEAYSTAGPDGIEIDCKYSYMPINHAIEVVEQSIVWDEEKQMETSNETISYYHADASSGIISVPYREYQMASKKYLSIEDLKPYSKKELKIMRNEIFASHGFIFKTEALKNYFSNMIWYFPTFDNVDDLFSDIEKENVRLIKKVENQM